MFPLKTDDTLKTFPFVTLLVITTCISVHILRIGSFSATGLIPLDIIHSFLHFDHDLPQLTLTLVASFFVHGSILHLAGNVWYLWIFGGALEQHLPRLKFAFVYIACGVASMAAQVLSNPLSTIPIVGASGAIAGIMGMYLMFRPFSWIVFYLPPFFFFKIPAIIFLLGWFFLQWYSSQLPHDNSMVAWWAHIGGFISGILLWLNFRLFGSRKKRRSFRNSAR